MPMTTDQSTKYGTLGTTANALQDAIANYAAKSAAANAAQAALATAQSTLDAAVVAFRASDSAVDGAFPLPAGYTPPS